ncbi:helix-turn-helix domain-containing protein [Streptomyces sp. NPDC004959]|uniref:helix-turn-helix transcriptional regulator n=1 Tax=Streptomyces sp. NPDC004959 TaxID=3154673 RepID=UPI0033BEFBBA
MLSPKELADWLGISLQAVYHLNHDSTGPAYYVVGGQRVRYRRSDVEAWLEARRSNRAAA